MSDDHDWEMEADDDQCRSLFGEDLPETLSPREKWIRENGVTVKDESDAPRYIDKPWSASCGNRGAYGADKDEAIARLAAHLEKCDGVKHWLNQ